MPSSHRRQHRPGPGTFRNEFLPEIPSSQVAIIPRHRLGKGSQGEVYVATVFRELVAVKLFYTQPDVDDDDDDEAWSVFHQEAVMLAGLSHRNVAALRGVCRKPLCIATEFCPKGSLYGLVGKQEFRGWGWVDRLKLVAGVGDGLFFLHNRGRPIIHGDLKSPNVVLKQDWTPVIIDFGLARYGCTRGRNPTNPTWLAPELLDAKNQATQKSDVYSFAIIMWEILTGDHPWQEDRLAAVPILLTQGKRPEIPDLPRSWTGVKEYVELMKRCWAQDPEDRPDITQIVKVLDDIKSKAGQQEGPGLKALDPVLSPSSPAYNPSFA